ncbi:MAG: hypothetical protein ACOX6Y_05680 [Christensenellales bacterium]|jgi:transcriptional regulator with XRE-family HTH domain
MITQELRQLRMALNRSRLSRREAAAALHLSYSAFNRKLRGEAPLWPEEIQALYEHIRKKGQIG